MQERERRERLRLRRVLTLGDVELSADRSGYAAIFEHVSGSLHDDLLAVTRPARLD